jgi:YD repeat-containing protein
VAANFHKRLARAAFEHNDYAYDARSRLTTITYPAVTPNPATTTAYTYDGMGRMLTTTDQASKVTTKTYFWPRFFQVAFPRCFAQLKY